MTLRSILLIGLLTASQPSFGQSAPKEVLKVDVCGGTAEEKLALLVLQGIANRQGPRVFLSFGDDNRWLSWDFESGRNNGVGPIWDQAAADSFGKKHRSTDDAWSGILQDEGYTFTSVAPSDLLKRLRAEWKGWLVYQEIGTDLAPAATWAGLDDLIPVTPALMERWKKEGIDAETKADYGAIRKAFGKGNEARLAGHRWLIDHLLERCRKNGAVSRDKTYGLDKHDTIVDIDQAAQNRWVVYDLSHVSHENKASTVRKESPDPPDKPLLDELLGKLDDFSFVYGWGRDGEESFVRSLNRNGLLPEVSGVPNTSFFAKLPAPKPPYKQKRRPIDPDKITPEDKIYVTFMVNEGDSLKAAATFMCFGAWLQPERGKIPINWGIEPNLLLSHPWLMNYYYQTMTENDFFFAPPSGWGYAHPGSLPENMLMPYAGLVRDGMKLADLQFINIWWLNGIKDPAKRNAFLKATGARGHVDWTGDRQAVEYPADGVTNICSNHFYTYKTPAADFAKTLIADMKDVRPPWFVAIYGAMEHGTPHRFHQLAQQLPMDRFKIVALDEFFAAAEASKGKMQGRVWKPGPDSPKGVAP
jgi:hypothetical protein